MPRKQPVICIDVDGVIASRNPLSSKIGIPLPNSKQFLLKLSKLGWKIIIFSCRPSFLLKKYFKKYNLYYDEISSGKTKPVADIYLDDKGLTFNGNFKDILKKIENFKPWWGKV